jgi:hypothetical protein
MGLLSSFRCGFDGGDQGFADMGELVHFRIHLEAERVSQRGSHEHQGHPIVVGGDDVSDLVGTIPARVDEVLVGDGAFQQGAGEAVQVGFEFIEVDIQGDFRCGETFVEEPLQGEALFGEFDSLWGGHIMLIDESLGFEIRDIATRIQKQIARDGLRQAVMIVCQDGYSLSGSSSGSGDLATLKGAWEKTLRDAREGQP